MTKRKREYIPSPTKIASALLAAVHEVDGKLVPIIPREIAANLSAGEIISMVDWNHIVPHAIGGSDHPSNLEPMLRPEHRRRTAKIDVPQIAKTKRIARKHEAHGNTILAKISLEDRVAKDDTKPKRKWQQRPMPGTKASGVKKKFSGEVQKR